MNEVLIVVKAKNDTKAVFDTIRKDARNLGDTMAVDVNEQFTKRLETEARNNGGNIARVGDTLGETLGARISERITERINVDVNERLRDSRGRFISRNGSTTINNSNRDRTTINNGGGGGGDRDRVHVTVDVDKKSLLQRFSDIGKTLSEKIRGGLTEGFTSFFSGGDIWTNLIKGAGVAGLAGLLGPVLGAAISSSLLVAVTGGALGVGIAAALKDPRIQTAFNGIKAQAKDLFTSFGDYFKGPLENFLAPGNKGGGGIVGLLKQIEPMVKSLGESLGPVADLLGQGIIGGLQNFLPSLFRFVEAGEPLIKTLADELPGIGDALGDMFDSIAGSGPAANQFWNDFLNILQLVIRGVGKLVAVLTNMYAAVRPVIILLIRSFLNFFQIVTGAAAAAFGWVPGLGPKLQTAASKVTQFKNRVNEELRKMDRDVDITVRIRQVFSVVGQVAGDVGRILGRRAAGGIVGAASGGIRNGLTWVGEHGPELAEVKPGGRVWSNPDSMRMAGQGGGSRQPLVVQLMLDGRILAERLLDPQREIVDRRFGGSAQAAWGR